MKPLEQSRRIGQVVAAASPSAIENSVVFWFKWSAAVSETSRSIFDVLRLTLRAQPRSAKFQIQTLPKNQWPP